MRALDQATGQVLWETEVSAAMEGIPAIYEIDGQEYIVFCAAAQTEIARPGSKRRLRFLRTEAISPFACRRLNETVVLRCAPSADRGHPGLI